MNDLWILLVLCIWGGITWLLWKACNKFLNAATSSRTVRVGIITIVSLLWVGVSFWHAGGRKIYYDVQVGRMCRVDGGIKIYETVSLPPEKFGKSGQVNFYRPIQGENALGGEYIFKSDSVLYKNENPSIWRSHYQIIRRRDGVTLGESISYSRRGGDFIGPWHESSHGCPEERGPTILLTKIFQKQSH